MQAASDFSSFATFKPIRSIFLLAFSFALFTQFAFAQDESASKAIELFQKGQDQHEKGDYKAAVDLYRQALEVLPEFPEAELQLGNALLALDLPLEAEKCFRRAIELRENWGLAWAVLGKLLLDKGERVEAETVLKKSLELEPNEPIALSALADARLSDFSKNKDKTPLIEILGIIAPLNKVARPTSILLTAEGAIHLALGDNEKAIENAKRALIADNKSTSAFAILAEAYLRTGNFDLAEKYTNSIALQNNSSQNNNPVRIISLRARIAAARGDSEEAIKILETALSGNKAIELQQLLSEIRSESTQSPEELEKQLSESPDNANLLGRLCKAYRVTDPAKAIDYCQKALEKDKSNLGYAIGLGAALVKAQKYDPAIRILTRVKEIAPDNSVVRANLATALFQSANFKPAAEEFFWLTQNGSNPTTAYYFLAICLDRLEDYPAALENYKRFL
ncbi:MAG TPA: tetratricopeptide repeat protein, partial [Pyrinomonadaceae bacterium]|nr:tetratricopeptide repeat protein [Pyrinomonadaceae bacterium]